MLSGAESLSTLPEICPALYLVVLCLATPSLVYTDEYLEISAILAFVPNNDESLFASWPSWIFLYPDWSTSYVT